MHPVCTVHCFRLKELLGLTCTDAKHHATVGISRVVVVPVAVRIHIQEIVAVARIWRTQPWRTNSAHNLCSAKTRLTPNWNSASDRTS